MCWYRAPYLSTKADLQIRSQLVPSKLPKVVWIKVPPPYVSTTPDIAVLRGYRSSCNPQPGTSANRRCSGRGRSLSMHYLLFHVTRLRRRSYRYRDPVERWC